MAKLVIAGSASLQDKIAFWKKYWETQEYTVIAYPNAIAAENFLTAYPKVHADFFNSILEADQLFVMNEDKNGIPGYLGAESFAEMCFAVTQNLINNKKIKIILLQMPDKAVQSYSEITLWLQLGWIKLLNPPSAQA